MKLADELMKLISRSTNFTNLSNFTDVRREIMESAGVVFTLALMALGVIGAVVQKARGNW